MASSRVGSRIRVRMDLDVFLAPSCKRFCKMGRANAAVFPVPVWAIPIKSLRVKIGGMAFS